MTPTTFAEANRILTKPEGMTDDECGSLPTYADGQQTISCWRPTWRERLSILFFGRVWLQVWFGSSQPPVALSGARTIFEPAKGSKGMPAAAALVLLLAVIAVPASAQPAPCGGSLALWSATQTATGGSQRVLVGSRAEGGCNAFAGFRAWGRLDAYALPGRTVSLADPTTFENVAAVEGWAGLSRPVVGPLSLAVFGGMQRSLEGGTLGLGGATQSLCAGGRLDYGGGFAVGGLCSRYSPAQQTEPRKDGPALVGTVVLPIKKAVRLAANAAFTRGDYVVTFGPTVGLGQ